MLQWCLVVGSLYCLPLNKLLEANFPHRATLSKVLLSLSGCKTHVIQIYEKYLWGLRDIKSQATVIQCTSAWSFQYRHALKGSFLHQKSYCLRDLEFPFPPRKIWRKGNFVVMSTFLDIFHFDPKIVTLAFSLFLGAAENYGPFCWADQLWENQ